ncbi:TPA: hypothetical protein N0F65_006643 [Lagenidium giganteum]|uniref:Uncharacterized protein n=1 Tax=Lagenidium giganteum TaxID=4803 RepID=A0AAV2ZCD0_9STRA|nr:TPA: hypothetical protein N0F65_006643 [Lagenidium giganteum]
MLAAIAVSTLYSVTAAPLQTNPTMPMEDIIELNHENPAFGAAIESPIYTTEVSKNVVADNVTVVNGEFEFDLFGDGEFSGEAVASRLRRRMEAVNDDIGRIERALNKKLERNVNKLKTQGEAASIPWPSDYWAVANDGINARWNDNEDSTSVKYAKAFKLDPKKLTDAISRNNGVLSQTRNKPCTNDNQCASLNDGSKCAIREGESRGYCIPTWFGVCHAWAPAAIQEPEPKCPVTKNGVTFRVFDIKALMTQIYDGARVGSVFTGARYDGEDDGPTDHFGRFIDAAHRDIGPGFFHIVFSNMLGDMKRSFVLDVDAGNQVWNQPVRGYKILHFSTCAEGNK